MPVRQVNADSKLAVGRYLAFFFTFPACGGSLSRPPPAPQPASAFVSVAFPPPAVELETVPPRPAATAVWVDGQWVWDGSVWAWSPGAWVEAAWGARYASWALRLRQDGTLEFAPASWRDGLGRLIPTPRVLARAVGAEAAGGAATCR
jgi:hypothetical protein